MTHHLYCTYFDSAYAARGRVLIESLREQGDRGSVYVLALDEPAFIEVSTWRELNVQPLTLADLEAAFPRLREARSDRSRMEYIFTLTPWLTRWVMDRQVPNGWVTYLDADMAFFATTDAIYAEVTEGSVAVVEHRFTWEQAWRRKYGRFNVAWVGFRNDERGRSCLDWWAERCLEWCRDEVSDGRFADQGYLDRFPEFLGVQIIKNPGVDVAPWNLRRHTLSWGPTGRVLVDGDPLVFFHFHGLRKSGSRYRFKHLPYFARTSVVLREGVYRPYCTRLEEAAARLGTASPTVLDRRLTLATSLRTGRTDAMRWLGDMRGDYLDLEPPP